MFKARCLVVTDLGALTGIAVAEGAPAEIPLAHCLFIMGEGGLFIMVVSSLNFGKQLTDCWAVKHLFVVFSASILVAQPPADSSLVLVGIKYPSPCRVPAAILAASSDVLICIFINIMC